MSWHRSFLCVGVVAQEMAVSRLWLKITKEVQFIATMKDQTVARKNEQQEDCGRSITQIAASANWYECEGELVYEHGCEYEFDCALE